jgi:hypothetical protein
MKNSFIITTAIALVLSSVSTFASENASATIDHQVASAAPAVVPNAAPVVVPNTAPAGQLDKSLDKLGNAAKDVANDTANVVKDAVQSIDDEWLNNMLGNTFHNMGNTITELTAKFKGQPTKEKEVQAIEAQYKDLTKRMDMYKTISASCKAHDASKPSVKDPKIEADKAKLKEHQKEIEKKIEELKNKVQELSK